MYATQPALEALHNRLQIDEAELLAETRGVFSLGQNFVGIGGQQNLLSTPTGRTAPPSTTNRSFRIGCERGPLAPMPSSRFLADRGRRAHGRMLIPIGRRRATVAQTTHIIASGRVRPILEATGTAAWRPIHGRNDSQRNARSTDGDVAADHPGSGPPHRRTALHRRDWGRRLVDRHDARCPTRELARLHPVDRIVVASGVCSRPFHLTPRFELMRTVGSACTQLARAQVIHAYSSARCDAGEALESAAAVSPTRSTERDDPRPLSAFAHVRGSEMSLRSVARHARLIPSTSVDAQALQLGLVHLLSLFPVAEQASDGGAGGVQSSESAELRASP